MASIEIGSRAAVRLPAEGPWWLVRLQRQYRARFRLRRRHKLRRLLAKAGSAGTGRFDWMLELARRG